jgi:sugar phosphate isomerase/epimerase
MRIGLCTKVFATLGAREMLARVRALGRVEAIEISTGGSSGREHIDMELLLTDPALAREYRQMVADAGLTISALACHGNPLHPDEDRAKIDDEVFRKTIRLAERLDVSVVVTFSGCPGDGDGASHPNWVTSPWPPEFQEILDWQWNEKAMPYWSDAARFAANHGVGVAIQPHPGFLVYNVETALKLRAAAGKSIGVTLDPSHLFWQGADVPSAVRALGSAIFHVHAKDAAVDAQNVRVNGVIDAKSHSRLPERAWLYRAVGWGHGELEWRRIVSALRLAGYDQVMSIDHEDAFASVDEGLRSSVEFLSRVVLAGPPAEPWWA